MKKPLLIGLLCGAACLALYLLLRNIDLAGMIKHMHG